MYLGITVFFGDKTLWREHSHKKCTHFFIHKKITPGKALIGVNVCVDFGKRRTKVVFCTKNMSAIYTVSSSYARRNMTINKR